MKLKLISLTQIDIVDPILIWVKTDSFRLTFMKNDNTERGFTFGQIVIC